MKRVDARGEKWNPRPIDTNYANLTGFAVPPQPFRHEHDGPNSSPYTHTSRLYIHVDLQARGTRHATEILALTKQV